MQDKIIINDYIENDPLSEDNLNTILEIINRFRLLSPKKTIWIYTGYEWEHIFDDSYHYHPQTAEKLLTWRRKRQEVIKLCDVMIDGQYIDVQRDITLKWRGSNNQRVVDIQESLNQGKLVLYCD